MNKLYLLLMSGAFFCSACSNTENANTETTEIPVPELETTAPEVRLEQVWATENVMETPESVYYYAPENVLFVSNIAGDPTGQDNTGYISKLSPEGEIINKEWVTGLDAPKGMAVKDGMLYVTNIDELVAIEISTGTIKNRYPVQNAQFLNDVVLADDRILFTDMNDNKIYALQDGQISAWVTEGLEKPNGLAYVNGNVVLASNQLQVVNANGENQVLAEGIGFGDGIGVVDENSYLVSNWQGEVYYVTQGTDKVKLLDTKAQNMNTADITYIQDQNLLLVPTFNDNRVVAYKLIR